MTTFELSADAEVSPEERRMLDEAKKLPVAYDDDCPELTDEMEEAFLQARRRKPYRCEKAS